MLQIVPQLEIVLVCDPVDFRKGIDGLSAVCRQRLDKDPFSGALFCFRNRRATAIKFLIYDGQGFWLCMKRLSKGKLIWWPAGDGNQIRLAAQELQTLIWNGDPSSASFAPEWRHVGPRALEEGSSI